MSKIESACTRRNFRVKEDEEGGEEAGELPPPPHDAVVRWGEERQPDVKESEGHGCESDRWSENHRVVKEELTDCVS